MKWTNSYRSFGLKTKRSTGLKTIEHKHSIIQNVKTRARGFRNMDYFSTMIYLTCGRLDLRTVAT